MPKDFVVFIIATAGLRYVQEMNVQKTGLPCLNKGAVLQIIDVTVCMSPNSFVKLLFIDKYLTLAYSSTHQIASYKKLVSWLLTSCAIRVLQLA